jgi:broad specificity phosphatase PhoE
MHLSGFIAAKYDRFIQPLVMPELREVQFELLKIHSESHAPSRDMDLLNQSVFRAMTNGDSGCESAAAAYERMGKFLEVVSKEGSVVVAHDFILRIAEIYIRNYGASLKIAYEDLIATQRNLYLRGFATDAGLRKILPL